MSTTPVEGCNSLAHGSRENTSSFPSCRPSSSRRSRPTSPSAASSFQFSWTNSEPSLMATTARERVANWGSTITRSRCAPA